MISPNWISFRLTDERITQVQKVRALLKEHQGLDISFSKVCQYLIKQGAEIVCQRMERALEKEHPELKSVSVTMPVPEAEPTPDQDLS